ncbi:MAG: alpha/beta hydrolase family esterase [Paracoccaceae bacterium]
MRRVVIALCAVLASFIAGPDAAHAECSYNAQFDPCAVQDGHYRIRTPGTGGPYPTLVYFYGSVGTSDRYVESKRFQDQIVGRGYALLVPAALSMTFSSQDGDRYRGGGWNLRHPRYRTGRDDVAFVGRVLDDAKRRFNIDRSNLVFVGQSHGGMFLWDIACHTPRMARAYAIHGASHGGELPTRCSNPVRFLQTHGRRDDIVPFKGERRSGKSLINADISEGLALLGRTNRCRTGPEDVGRLGPYARSTWRGCAPGSSLDFLAHGGGHGYPGNWITTVLDWYEDGFDAAADGAASGATVRPRFNSAQDRGSRFKGVDSRDGARFQRPKAPDS